MTDVILHAYDAINSSSANMNNTITQINKTFKDHIGFGRIFHSTVQHMIIEARAFPQVLFPVAQPALLFLHSQLISYYAEDAQLSPLLHLGTGATAGIIAMLATYPMDMVRGRITVQTEKSPYQYRGMFHSLRTVLVEEGPRALYKDWLPSVIGVIPYVGLNFAVYESLKECLVKSRPLGMVDGSELGVMTKPACGAAAGTVGQIVAYPLDVICRRMQMVGWKDAASVVTGDGRSQARVEYSAW